jgi:hypothetical protein
MGVKPENGNNFNNPKISTKRCQKSLEQFNSELSREKVVDYKFLVNLKLKAVERWLCRRLKAKH